MTSIKAQQRNIRVPLLSKASGQKNVILGLIMLAALLAVGAATVQGFLSGSNVRSMLLLGAFLGLASVGQTLCALLGGLDLSIPYLIGSANIGTLYMISSGVPAGMAIVITLVLGIVVGTINGLISLHLQNQALIVSLGVGFATVGATQVLTSAGASNAGGTSGVVPDWLANISSLSGETLGVPVPPVILIWLVLAAALIFIMRSTWFGRSTYALGGNRSAARLMLISEPRRWVTVYALSGLFSGATGILLLGFTGGAFVRVGDPYLFLTVAAVAVGGTSLLGGRGGYGSTLVGVLVLIALTSLLVGYGLNNNAQQFVLGLLIVPLVGFYARNPHIRQQI
ncbi:MULTISPECIES: ABC transporter permease [Paenarthrobacter]|uniref:ABC transporter permease n=1 Tax=Paenarthrobacter TaxID=1742992 RepID=UPI00074D4996|nr:ABC transporter permease [Paenarthrobacter ureafaciens]AMB40242.1 sugar ABC transporter permease [Arthrobacter sp. ATCC 21022]KUR63455.1 sugar ABC transporter permease [Arthrobacter sp. ATCC 21022]RWW91404.1 ABC transporter permease [Paenarthrobacter ureafaciens]